MGKSLPFAWPEVQIIFYLLNFKTAPKNWITQVDSSKLNWFFFKNSEKKRKYVCIVLLSYILQATIL